MLFVCFARFLQVVGVGEEEMLEMSHISVSESHDFRRPPAWQEACWVVCGVTVHPLSVAGKPSGFPQARLWAFRAVAILSPRRRPPTGQPLTR